MSDHEDTDKRVDANFSAYYLKQATHELAEDLNKVRDADDFKSDSVPFLIHALQQGTTQFSSNEKKRVVSLSDPAQTGRC